MVSEGRRKPKLVVKITVEDSKRCNIAKSERIRPLCRVSSCMTILESYLSHLYKGKLIGSVKRSRDEFVTQRSACQVAAFL
ncbi:hypothetical protein E2C01_036594 [Portunus trituberculatus]|uniref:Uncharacterized protein n=1 Tax=Portunus trituberculatus TaxID=210409 RepID=A0A5B7FCH7_PORTR|nr:hypothetical protein [Portunus trituberculatus]